MFRLTKQIYKTVVHRCIEAYGRKHNGRLETIRTFRRDATRHATRKLVRMAPHKNPAEVEAAVRETMDNYTTDALVSLLRPVEKTREPARLVAALVG